MALYTSYLGLLITSFRKLSRKTVEVLTQDNAEIIYVMRNRGNSPVEPPGIVLRLFKEGAITWEGYQDAYLDSLKTSVSAMWMQNVAKKAFDHDVVLICFKKGPQTLPSPALSRIHTRTLRSTIHGRTGMTVLKGEGTMTTFEKIPSEAIRDGDFKTNYVIITVLVQNFSKF